MKILVLTSAARQPDNRLLWEGLRRYCKVELHCLDKNQQENLGEHFTSIAVDEYDWVVLDLLFKKICRQTRFLRCLPRLIICEEDACQEFIPGSRWNGKFSAFYRKVSQARVIITGYRVAEKFRKLGVDVRFLPKGYDSSKLYDSGSIRDIELGFIGRLASDAYRKRREFLERCAATFGLKIMRTEPGEDYRVALNRIKVFVSADIGLGEYMAKNFEAMACGCLLLAYRQGEGEEESLGLKHGDNVFLYGDFEELARIISTLRSDPDLCRFIAGNGKTHAVKYFDYYSQSMQFHAFLKEEPRETKKSTSWGFLKGAGWRS